MRSESCRLCLLSSAVVPISGGVCSLCAHDDQKVMYKGEAELIKLLEIGRAHV